MLRFFAVMLPMHQVDPAAPAGFSGRGGCTCEFCGCGLAADGAVLRTSDKARKLARIDERIETLEGELVTARGRVTEAEQQLAAAVAELKALKDARPPAPAPAARGLHFSEG